MISDFLQILKIQGCQMKAGGVDGSDAYPF
jgi:hypothetical protein